jgi:CRISPR/Cas system-associated endoribonuclease Cas2
MKQDLENLLISLSEVAEDILSVNTNRRGVWFWDYYKKESEGVDNKKKRDKIYNQIYHLERFGYINKKGITKKGFLKLITAKGKKQKEKKWDKKWRVVIFDIPEEIKSSRNYLRRFLIDIGFDKLQNSVWVSPYNNFEEVQDLVRRCKIEEYVILMIVDRVSNDLLLKKKFGL